VAQAPPKPNPNRQRVATFCQTPVTKCQIPASPANCLLSKILCRSHPEALPEYSADYEANQVRKWTMDEQHTWTQSAFDLAMAPICVMNAFNLRYALCVAFII
jgi:hypothetical protein